MATVVVVAWNGAHLLDACLDAVAEQHLDDVFITRVIDNASTDASAAVAAGHPIGARVVTLERNVGFAGAAELAVREATTPFVVVLNQDACPSPGWLAALLAPLTAPESHRVGAVTSKVLFERDGRINNTGVIVRRDGYGRDRGFGEPDDGRFVEAEDVFAFSGTAAAIRVLAARDAGSFDPSFFLYYEDTDLSWRLQLAGWRVRYAPDAIVHHVHAASSDISSKAFAFYNERNRLLMLAKCAPLLLAVKEVVRFATITVLLPVRRLRRVEIPSGHQFRTPLRLRVLGSYARLLPSMLVKRRAVSRSARRSRAEVARELT
ncbi:MAG TPA: glycosyltransferase family 2 protein [Acidothermaceae bacterium]|nr:glycosyltransferase family 2 protein [Acidothermaceae bacterium]